MNSIWYQGQADIITYKLDELIATKLRALYQRRKGRDLFDIGYVATHSLINLNRVLDTFYKYCAYNNIEISKKEFIDNLTQKKENRDFYMDMKVLLPSKLHWNFEEAYQFVIEHIINKLL
jgi:predicted nucleotidyltransferase component of viral defense system